MFWLILCIAAAAIWSFSAFIDNYLTDVIFSNRLPHAMKVLNGPIYIFVAILISLILQVPFPEMWQFWLLLLSGAINSIASLPYYSALKNEEATGAVIFYQLQPVLFLISDYLIFGQKISVQQIIGFILILAAPLIVVFSRKRASARKMEMRAAILLILFVVVSTVSSSIAVHVGETGINIFTVFVYYLLGRGIMDCIFGLLPKFRQRHRYIVNRHGSKYVIPLVINQFLCCAADFAYRYGMILGIAALASAFTNAAQLILTFLFGLVLTIIWPKFGREKLRRDIVLAHVIAVILCVIGIIVIQ